MSYAGYGGYDAYGQYSSGYAEESPRRGSSKSKRSKTKEQQYTRPEDVSLSFLFMVNELFITHPATDEYHHFIPPTSPEDYHAEAPSKVMRYNNGAVEEVFDCQWSPNDRCLWYVDRQSGNYEAVQEHNKFAVFACNPLLPIMVVDQDPMAVDTNAAWQLLQLFHPRGLEGVTQVATEDSAMGDGPGLKRYTAGNNPSWVPNLVPETYRRTNGAIEIPSAGLGGELPIILALMALSARPDSRGLNSSTNDVFLGGHGSRASWRGRRWTSHGPPRGHPATCDDEPRGYLAIVFYDPLNPEGSNLDTLRHFEWQTTVVRER